MPHVILLCQTSKSDNSRKWSEFSSQSEAMDDICQMFEKHLKQKNPDSRKIEYGVDDLYEYVENMADFVALVYSPKSESYLPKNKKWIKDALLSHIRNEIDN